MCLRPPSGPSYSSPWGVSGDRISSIVIDRQGQYQTELFIVPPKVKEIRSHNHPGIDSYEHHLAGDFVFTVAGEAFLQYSNGEPLGSVDRLQKVEASAWHGGEFQEGGSFLSFQYWHDGVRPTTVGDSFVVLGERSSE